MRTLILLGLGGIAVGVALAFLIAETRPAPTVATCTAQRLGLAPTLAVPPSGGTIQIGVSAPGTGCVVSPHAARTVRIRVEGGDGRVLADSVQQGAPPPGVEIAVPLRGSIAVAAARLCRAAQPLRIDIWVAGAHTTGYQSVQLVGGRCTLAS